MPVVPIKFPTSTSPGRHPQESAGRLINCFAEPLGEGARALATYRRVSGLSSFGTTSEADFRGMQLVNSTLYAAWTGKVYRFTSAGGAGTLVGNLAGSNKVFWARNNKAVTPDIVAVSPGEGAFTVTSGAVTTFADTDLPIPVDVAFHGGYFHFPIGDGRFFASGLNDITINALDFATAESKPDTLYRVIPYASQILYCGSNSMEVWGPPINATGYPYSYVTTIPKGLISVAAIAGYEDGLDQRVVFVADDNTVRMLVNYEPQKISPPDLDDLIEKVTDKTTIEAGAYVSRGHHCIVISSDDWTWVFDLNTQKWHERESYGLGRWRGTRPHYAFGKWLVGDTESGNILQLSSSVRNEAGEPLRMRLESSPATAFPGSMVVHKTTFNITRGVGIANGTEPNQTDPTGEFSWSDDGGENWSNPIIRALGRQAVANGRIVLGPTGRTTDAGRRWRVDISDDVEASVMGGAMQAEGRG